METLTQAFYGDDNLGFQLIHHYWTTEPIKSTKLVHRLLTAHEDLHAREDSDADMKVLSALPFTRCTCEDLKGSKDSTPRISMDS